MCKVAKTNCPVSAAVIVVAIVSKFSHFAHHNYIGILREKSFLRRRQSLKCLLKLPFGQQLPGQQDKYIQSGLQW